MKLAPIAHQRLIKILSFAGYFTVRQKGSHIILENPLTKKVTIVPARTKNVGIGLLSVILKEAEISRERYFGLLEKA